MDPGASLPEKPRGRPLRRADVGASGWRRVEWPPPKRPPLRRVWVSLGDHDLCLPRAQRGEVADGVASVATRMDRGSTSGPRATDLASVSDTAGGAPLRAGAGNVRQSSEAEAGDERLAEREDSAQERRQWVRLTDDCNNRCMFCLDPHAHLGRVRPDDEIRRAIIEGRRRGATRLILSGGEPTLHPRFLDFARLGKRAGYRRVQTVTNGRMFAYPAFLAAAAASGLDELTFSLHGHHAKLHDALVGVRGAFEQTTTGLRAALASGRFIVNVDTVINKQNVRHLPEMLETFLSWGVREFDLLQIIPFGAAWGRAREHLFYDLDGHEEALHRAFALAARPDVQLWLNRFPPEYAEGFEALLQDPYKLEDEVRGRHDEFSEALARATATCAAEEAAAAAPRFLPSCREPARCRHCVLHGFCDRLEGAAADLARGPARDSADLLRLVRGAPEARRLPAARVAWVVARDAAEARRLLEGQRAASVWLELDDYAELLREREAEVSAPALAAPPGDAAPEPWRFGGLRVSRCVARDAARLTQVLRLAELARLAEGDAAVELTVAVHANRDTEALLLGLVRDEALPASLCLIAPCYARVAEHRRRDVALPSLLAALRSRGVAVATEGFPPCLGGTLPDAAPLLLDTASLDAEGGLDLMRFAARHIEAHALTKSRRCRDCAANPRCLGVHLNFVRAHGYAALQPLVAASAAAASADGASVKRAEGAGGAG